MSTLRVGVRCKFAVSDHVVDSNRKLLPGQMRMSLHQLWRSALPVLTALIGSGGFFIGIWSFISPVSAAHAFGGYMIRVLEASTSSSEKGRTISASTNRAPEPCICVSSWHPKPWPRTLDPGSYGLLAVLSMVPELGSCTTDSSKMSQHGHTCGRCNANCGRLGKLPDRAGGYRGRSRPKSSSNACNEDGDLARWRHLVLAGLT